MLKAKGSKALSLVLAVAMLVTLCCTYLFTSAEPIKAVGKTESVQLTYGGDHVWPKDGKARRPAWFQFLRRIFPAWTFWS